MHTPRVDSGARQRSGITGVVTVALLLAMWVVALTGAGWPALAHVEGMDGEEARAERIDELRVLAQASDPAPQHRAAEAPAGPGDGILAARASLNGEPQAHQPGPCAEGIWENAPWTSLWIDVIGFGASFYCDDATLILSALTADLWAPSDLDAMVWWIDTTGSGSDGCEGDNAAVLVSGGATLEAAVVMMPSCDSGTWELTELAFVDRAGASDFVGVALSHASIGAPESIRFFGTATNVHNSTMEFFPQSGRVELTGLTSAAPEPEPEPPPVPDPDPPPAPDIPVTRHEGADRIATSVQVSSTHWEEADVAVLATAWDFPDALVAGPLAAVEGAPVLLSDPDDLPRATTAELERLGVGHVVLLGGSAALSASVEAAVGDLAGNPSVERIAGANRYETAALVAERVGAPAGEVTVALGSDFPDAVAAGALAAAPTPTPTLLTAANAVPDASLAVIDSLDVEQGTVLGGPAAIADSAVAELEAAGVAVQRLAGADRYATSAKVAAEAIERLGDDDLPVIFATGANYPDALAAGALAAREGGPLLLTGPNALAPEVAELVVDHADRWSEALLIGGPAAITDAAEASILSALAGVEATDAQATSQAR